MCDKVGKPWDEGGGIHGAALDFCVRNLGEIQDLRAIKQKIEDTSRTE